MRLHSALLALIFGLISLRAAEADHAPLMAGATTSNTLEVFSRYRSPMFLTNSTHVSPTKGDWVGWVGKYEDIVNGTKGQDTTYPGVEVLPDGTIVTTTYGHRTESEPAYVVSVQFKLEELDAKLSK